MPGGQRFRPRLRRIELRQNGLQRVEPRRERVAGIVESLPQMLREGGGFVVGQVKVHTRSGGDPNGRLELKPRLTTVGAGSEAQAAIPRVRFAHSA